MNDQGRPRAALVRFTLWIRQAACTHSPSVQVVPGGQQKKISYP